MSAIGASYPRPLSETEIAEALSHLPGWEHESHALIRTVTFFTSEEMLAFLMYATVEADALEHFPVWRIQRSRMEIRLSTAAAGQKVTRVDLELASRLQPFLPEC